MDEKSPTPPRRRAFSVTTLRDAGSNLVSGILTEKPGKTFEQDQPKSIGRYRKVADDDYSQKDNNNKKKNITGSSTPSSNDIANTVDSSGGVEKQRMASSSPASSDGQGGSSSPLMGISGCDFKISGEGKGRPFRPSEVTKKSDDGSIDQAKRSRERGKTTSGSGRRRLSLFGKLSNPPSTPSTTYYSPSNNDFTRLVNPGTPTKTSSGGMFARWGNIGGLKSPSKSGSSDRSISSPRHPSQHGYALTSPPTPHNRAAAALSPPTGTRAIDNPVNSPGASIRIVTPDESTPLDRLANAEEKLKMAKEETAAALENHTTAAERESFYRSNTFNELQLKYQEALGKFTEVKKEMEHLGILTRRAENDVMLAQQRETNRREELQEVKKQLGLVEE